MMTSAMEETTTNQDQLGHTYYQKKMEQDLDTNDLLQNEHKLRKLYNLIHKEKIPIATLSKVTQKRFVQLEEAIAAQD